ncbi:uncharacterized protein LOC143828733 [Paroedura picta]|uniref:uncharacterized protein LOC143828733 n=1 Tax=Paroedura picta TaxID=143630 RepID=UPI00405733E6
MSGAGLLLQRFLQGQPRTLGALLLVIGLLQVAFGVIFTISPCVRRDELATHFYPAVLLILAGILSLAADKAKNLALVKACLVIYAICAVVVAVVNIFYLIDLVYAPNLRNIRRPITDAYSQSLHKVSVSSSWYESLVACMMITPEQPLLNAF